MRSVQTVIVGLGLAGATLALQLLRANRRICVISDGQAGASSVAAGLITPITGKKLKVQADYNSLLNSAITHYRAAEQIIGHAAPASPTCLSCIDGTPRAICMVAASITWLSLCASC